MNEIINIRNAQISDANFIAKTIMTAVGTEICLEFAGSEDNLHLVENLFTELAKEEMSQYSYKNTLIAETNNNIKVGAIICYDGANLKNLRKKFIVKSNNILNTNFDNDTMPNETDSSEIYIDSLMVNESYRGKGIATALIREAINRNKYLNKHFGLLVDYNNENAFKLYSKIGFKEDGEQLFAGTPMRHLTLKI